MPNTARSRVRPTGPTSSSDSRPPPPRVVAALALAIAALACSSGAPGAPAAIATPEAGGPATGVDAASARQHADAALDTLVSRYWRGGWFADGDGADAPPTQYWTSAQALGVVLDGVERSGGIRYADVVSSLYDRQDGDGWTRTWFDDEAWMGLSMLRAYEVLGDRRYLERAVSLAEDIAANAPDGSCCGTTPGGLWWDRDHTQKATAANAGAAMLAARLAERTGEARWLEFAKSTYAWWLANMVDASTGQVADHVDASGNKVWWRFTYNEGTMIGAAVALHRATGDARYLADARRIAAFTVSSEVRPTELGDVLFDGGTCSGDCEEFKGIGHRFLGELLADDPGAPGVAALLEADAAAVWALARAPDTGEFAVDWGGPPAGSASLAAVTSAGAALASDAARRR